MSDSVRPQRWQPTRLPCPWDSPGKNTGVGCHFLLQCMKVKSESEVAQSCPTPSKPMDCSLPGSSDRGIFQARVLEWGAIAFSGFSTVAAPIYMSTSSVGVFPTHSVALIFYFFDQGSNLHPLQWKLSFNHLTAREVSIICTLFDDGHSD